MQVDIGTLSVDKLPDVTEWLFDEFPIVPTRYMIDHTPMRVKLPYRKHIRYMPVRIGSDIWVKDTYGVQNRIADYPAPPVGQDTDIAREAHSAEGLYIFHTTYVPAKDLERFTEDMKMHAAPAIPEREVEVFYDIHKKQIGVGYGGGIEECEFTVTQFIPKKVLERYLRNGPAYIASTNVLIDIKPIKEPHPGHLNSNLAKRLNEVYELVGENTRFSSLIGYIIVDNETSIPYNYYMWVGNDVVEVSTVVNSYLPDGVYYIRQRMDGKGDFIKLADKDSDYEKIGLYKTREAAISKGDPVTLKKLEVELRKAEADQRQTNLQEELLALKKTAAELENRRKEQEALLKQLELELKRKEAEWKQREAEMKSKTERTKLFAAIISAAASLGGLIIGLLL